MPPTDEDALAAYVKNVLAQLKKNGLPDRRVAFPLERMYESAHAKGVNFNKVLEALSALGIEHEKTPEKLIFMARPEPVAASPFVGFDLAALEGMTPEQRMAAAAEAMRQLTPEQIAAMRAMVENMSEEERAEMIEQARKMGLT